MRAVTTFSPGHITGFFQICDQPMDPLLKGSRGAGVSITHGVTTKVSVKKSPKTFVKIGINGNITESAEVSEHVIKTFLSRVEGNYIVSVEHNVKIPMGSGYGASGAGALSLALALNKVFDLGLTRFEAAQVAHIAEVKCKTGLGTVIAETYGGLEIRMKPGAPGIGEIKNIHLTDEYAIVCLNFDSISTKEVLINERLSEKINKAGEKLVYELLMQPTPNMFMEFSRKFAEQVGLISERLWKTLREADRKGFTCSMPMLGESAFSLIKRDAVEELLKLFHKHALSGHSIIVAGIDFNGARIL